MLFSQRAVEAHSLFMVRSWTMPRRVRLAVAVVLLSAGCGLILGTPTSPCAEEFVIYEVEGQWYAERVDNGTNIFGPGSETDAIRACGGG